MARFLESISSNFLFRTWIAQDESLFHEFQNVDFEECSLTGLAILDVIIGYDRLIIIDTIKKASPETGKIAVLEDKDLRHIPGPSPHYVSIPQTIEIGRKVGQKVPEEIQIIALEAKNMYNLGEGLTKEMKLAVPAIIDRTIALVCRRENNE